MAIREVCNRCGRLWGDCMCIFPFGIKWNSLDRIQIDDQDPHGPWGYYKPPLELDWPKRDLFLPNLKCSRCGKILCECFDKRW